MNVFLTVFEVAEFESGIHCVKQGIYVNILSRIVFFKNVKKNIMRLIVNVGVILISKPYLTKWMSDSN